MPGAAIGQSLAHHFDKFRQQKEIVLKKRIRRHFPAVRRNAQDHLEAPLRWRMRSHVLDLVVERRLGDGTFLDIDDQAIVGADETNIETLFEFVPLAADHDAIAVAIGLRAGEHRRDDCRIKAANPLEKIADLFVLELKLGAVGEVLVLAAAAIAEIAASGLNALGGGLKHANQPGARKSFFDFGDLRLDSFAAGDERHEDDKIFHSPNAFAAKSSVADRQSH